MNICLIGDVFIDITLKTAHQDTKMRLGGIVHAARGLWALGISYSVGYFAPSYLDDQIKEYLTAFGCQEIYKLGNVSGSPYIFLIEEVKEIADQGYEFILRDEVKIEYFFDSILSLKCRPFSDILLIAGNFDNKKLDCLFDNNNIHLDITNSIKKISDLKIFRGSLKTIFLSTSSSVFSEYYEDDFNAFKNYFEIYCDRLLLKENRGGSRGFDFGTSTYYYADAQTKPIVHSVGVGDVYDTAFIFRFSSHSMQSSMNFSSWVAAEYASTTYPDDFKINTERILRSNSIHLENMKGVFLPWEDRSKINVYIAAPDFDFVDTTPIEKIVNSLQYHNFSPRRPVKENGQMKQNATKNIKREFLDKDLILLEVCQVLIAVLLYNDPGTLIEIGFASAKGIPVILYDPYRIAQNCVLTELPNFVTHDLDELISEFFHITSKLKNE